MRTKLLLILILLTACSEVVKPCNICGGGTGDIVVLALDGRALVNLGLSYDSYLGSWDQNGVWRESTYKKDQARFSLAFAYRLSKHLQFGVSLPYVMNFHNVPGLKQNGAGIGDIYVAGRYEFFHEFQVKKKNNKSRVDNVLPYLAVTFGITVPTGKSDENAQSEADVTGKGYYMSSLGISVTKSLIKNRLQVSTDFSWQHCFKKTYEKYFGEQTPEYTKDPGDKFNYSLSFNYIFNNWHAVSLSTSGFSQTAYHINSTIGQNSNEHNLNFIFAYTYYPIVPLRITPSVKWTIPGDNFGKNASASTTFNLNVTYYFADYNIK